jgi:hypothetical protein
MIGRLLRVVHRLRSRLARALLQLGVDVDSPSFRGGTPLHPACKRGHFDVTRLFVAHGALQSAPDGFYGNALKNLIDGSVHHAGEGGIMIRKSEEMPPRKHAQIAGHHIDRGAALPNELRGFVPDVDAAVRCGLLN